MAIDLNQYTRVYSDEFFNGYNAPNGSDVVLTPKNSGKLTFAGNVEIPGSSVEGGITKDANGNVNLGASEGTNKNTVKGTYNIASGKNNTVGENASQSAIIGGQNNVNDKDGSVILGGSNITAYRDNTAYVPDIKVEGVQVFGVDPISKKLYGEFNRSFEESTSMTVPHAATKGQDETLVGYIKLVYCGTPASEGSITSAKFDDTNLTCDGTWKEIIIPTADHGLIIALEGSGVFNYTAEINESAVTAE